ncbi:uncharacterized protein BXZ73DRAFT_73228 [Epithele typhae]|uniref:uncharacterized protein n=1 Tax=Epithele typhae TaxID=378194 RepID=UPI002008A51D|nr:uncharacterized protein BXZ73DRAFT_73228 [Epithele typhae]KAH9944997.1 hypothetical protein BXZ73DRAFT_73228 [Epithele typhae]
MSYHESRAIDNPDEAYWEGYWATCQHIPEWLQEHPELKQRGIQLRHMVKPMTTIDENDPGAHRHILPCELVDDERRFIIFPFMHNFLSVKSTYRQQWCWSRILWYYDLCLQDVIYLHRRHVAHLDIALENFVFSLSTDVLMGRSMSAEHPYLIDFEYSRQLPCGPGLQSRIELPPSIVSKPGDATRMDPYSWDVYCMGYVFQQMNALSPLKDITVPPTVVLWYIGWLQGSPKCICLSAYKVHATSSTSPLRSYTVMAMPPFTVEERNTCFQTIIEDIPRLNGRFWTFENTPLAFVTYATTVGNHVVTLMKSGKTTLGLKGPGLQHVLQIDNTSYNLYVYDLGDAVNVQRTVIGLLEALKKKELHIFTLDESCAKFR